jgi:hypothetical protein
MAVWITKTCNTCEEVNNINLYHLWLEFLNVIKKHDRSQEIVHQLLYIWIKCPMFCKHVLTHFCMSQNQDFSNEYVPWTWVFFGDKHPKTKVGAYVGTMFGASLFLLIYNNMSSYIYICKTLIKSYAKPHMAPHQSLNNVC